MNKLHLVIKKDYVKSLCDILNEISEINASAYFELLSKEGMGITVGLRMIRGLIDEVDSSTVDAYIGLYVIINENEKNMTCIIESNQKVTNNKFKIDVDKLWEDKKVSTLNNILESEDVLSESDRKYLKKYIRSLIFAQGKEN